MSHRNSTDRDIDPEFINSLRADLQDVATAGPIADATLAEKVMASHVNRGRPPRTRYLAAACGVAVALTAVVVSVLLSNRSHHVPAANVSAVTCPSSLDAWQRGALRDGTQTMTVPGSPESATVCTYVDRELSSTRRITGSRLKAVDRDLNDLPIGVMRCPENPRRVVLVRLTYASGPLVEFTAGVDFCQNGSNGARGLLLTTSAASALGVAS